MTFEEQYINVIAYNDSGEGVCLGSYDSTGYQQGNTTSYPNSILVSFNCGGGNDWDIGGDITLTFNTFTICVFIPSFTLPGTSLSFWIAEDGSIYWSNRDHQVYAVIDQDAEYAMNYDTAGLAASSYTCLGTSPCVNAGDTTIRAYGSTHTALTKNSPQVDIGYHPLNRGIIQVSEIGRLFEYEDGTPFIPIGGNPFCPEVFTNHSYLTWSKVSEYLEWYSSHGFNNIAIGGCNYPPDPYNHSSNTTDWQSFQRPVGTFQSEMFQKFTQLLDYADINNLTYYVGVFRNGSSWDTTDNNSQYNMWYKNSSIFYNNSNPSFHGVDTCVDIIRNDNAFTVETSTMAFYVDQWGNRESLFYWEPFVELNYLWDKTYSIDSNRAWQYSWVSRMIIFMHDYEIKKYGRTHLVSISSGYGNPGEGGGSAKMPDTGPGAEFAASRGVPSDLIITSFDTTQTQKVFFNHPKLDFVSMHPILIDDNNGLMTSFPLRSLAIPTMGGETSLWYDRISDQWLVDSAAILSALSIHSAVNMGFSLMTANIPYLNTEQGPDDYGAPWRYMSGPDGLYHDSYATGTCTTDRHISENLHRAINHFDLYIHMLSGGGGPGILYGFPPFNWSSPGNTEQQSCYTTKYSSLIFRNNYQNPLEYNILDDNMFNDQLGMYKVVTCFNWSGLKQWYNQNTSGRLTLNTDTVNSVIPFYAGDTDNLMIWLVRNTWTVSTFNYEANLSSITTGFTIHGFRDGYSYKITWYNSWTGETLGSSSFTGPTVNTSVPLPGYVRDVIAIIKPEESN